MWPNPDITPYFNGKPFFLRSGKTVLCLLIVIPISRIQLNNFDILSVSKFWKFWKSYILHIYERIRISENPYSPKSDAAGGTNVLCLLMFIPTFGTHLFVTLILLLSQSFESLLFSLQFKIFLFLFFSLRCSINLLLFLTAAVIFNIQL